MEQHKFELVSKFKPTGDQPQAINALVDNYYKNKVIRYDGYVLDRICSAVDCEIGDILKYNKDR